MQISLSPNITSIYILYNATFATQSTAATGIDRICIHLHTVDESNVFIS